MQKMKKQIPKGELRIGKSVPFKAIKILQYYHVKCAFDSFQKARMITNAITCMEDMDGFDMIDDSNRYS